MRNKILVDMDFERKTVAHHEDVYVDYDILLYKDLMRNRWNIWTEEPFKTASELCLGLRRVVNSSDSRQIAVLEIFEKHPRVIIFYSFDYERDILLNLYYGDDVQVAEWSGHKHQEVPIGEKWFIWYSIRPDARAGIALPLTLLYFTLSIIHIKLWRRPQDE